MLRTRVRMLLAVSFAYDGLVVVISAYRGHPRVRGSCESISIAYASYAFIAMPARDRVGGAWLRAHLLARLLAAAAHEHLSRTHVVCVVG